MANIRLLNEKYNKITNMDEPLMAKLGAVFSTKSYMQDPKLSKNKNLIEESCEFYRNYDSEFRVELLNSNPKYYLGLLGLASKFGKPLDYDNSMLACAVVKNAVDEYNSTNKFLRALSYLNPFPNKYRRMRNEIVEAKNFLVEKGFVRGALNEAIDHADRFLDGSAELSSDSFEDYVLDFESAFDQVSHFMDHADIKNYDPKIINTINTLQEKTLKEREYWAFIDDKDEIDRDFSRRAETQKVTMISGDGKKKKVTVTERTQFFKEKVDLDLNDNYLDAEKDDIIAYGMDEYDNDHSELEQLALE